LGVTSITVTNPTQEYCFTAHQKSRVRQPATPRSRLKRRASLTLLTFLSFLAFLILLAVLRLLILILVLALILLVALIIALFSRLALACGVQAIGSRWVASAAATAVVAPLQLAIIATGEDAVKGDARILPSLGCC